MTEIEALLTKAKRDLEFARQIDVAKYPEYVAGRAYYAMFHAAEAALLRLGLRYSKHSAVHAAFGKHLVKTGRLPGHPHRWLLNAFDLRTAADYDALFEVGSSAAVEVLKQAEEFVSTVEAWLTFPDTE